MFVILVWFTVYVGSAFSLAHRSVFASFCLLKEKWQTRQIYWATSVKQLTEKEDHKQVSLRSLRKVTRMKKMTMLFTFEVSAF